MKARHGREAYYIVGEGMHLIGQSGVSKLVETTPLEESTEFRFSRFIKNLRGTKENSTGLLAKLAIAMVEKTGTTDKAIPAGYTYLGQFIDHDLTLDKSELDLSKPIVLENLFSQRSPTLDLDSLYGRGPDLDPQWYADGVHLRVGRPLSIESPGAAQDGMDLPRWGGEAGGRFGTEREARIPDVRNDENLAVAQVHAAFIRFHNRVVDDLISQGTTSSVIFAKAREVVTKHYQWMVVNDYLLRIADPDAVRSVFENGRQHFETQGELFATMPVEFSGAAFRLGHSMIRTGYSWNKFFNATRAKAEGPIRSGHIFRLFRFSGTSGTMAVGTAEPGSEEDIRQLESPTEVGSALPSNWVADFTRLFDMSRFGAAFTPAAEDFNHAMAIDTSIVDPMKTLPIGSFGGVGEPDFVLKRNLAFRNLARGRMLEMPSGQQLAKALGVPPLSSSQITEGKGGVVIAPALIDGESRKELTDNTPLWFYILREAECGGKNKLAGVGATIVAETFHRAIEKSTNSILADPGFKPTLGPGASQGRFDMADLLHYAFQGRADLLNPH